MISTYIVKVYTPKYGANNGAPDLEFSVNYHPSILTDFDVLKRILLDNSDNWLALKYDLNSHTEPELRPDLADIEGQAVWLFEGEECTLDGNGIDHAETECQYDAYMVTVESENLDATDSETDR